MSRLRMRFAPAVEQPAPEPGERTLLQASDFTYLGNVRLPAPISGHRTDYVRGFTHRYVGAQLRFVCAIQRDPAQDGYSIMEFEYDGPLTTPGLASSGVSLVRNLGTGPIGGSTMGLRWHEASGKLIQNGDDLYTTSTDNPTIGYSTINEGAGTLNNFGPWRFAVSPSGRVTGKKTDGGVVEIPAWWRDLYTPGKDWACGFGSYRSLVHTGGTIGGALTALALADLAGATPGDIDSLQLMDYGFSAASYVTGDGTRPRRDDNYESTYDNAPEHWNPNPEGWWIPPDQMRQGVEWIDNGTKHGLFMTPTMSHGLCSYIESTLTAGGAHQAWFCYDPMHLAEVAQGSRDMWDLQPAWRVQPVTYPGWATNLPGWANYTDQMIGGLSMDYTTNVLYLCTRAADSTLGWPTDNPAAIHFYQVAA